MKFPSKIILAGFMGTGKTAVGKKLAEELNYPFIDTDSVVESLSEKTIERIFEEDGEAMFRRWESMAIDRALNESRAVIALGGGAVCFRHNLDKLKKNGMILLLKAGIPTILKRLKGKNHRPLLKGEDREEQMKALLAQRIPHYEKIALQISTDHKTPSDVAREILQTLPLEAGALEVQLGERSYPLYFHSKTGETLARLLDRHCPGDKAVVVTDRNVDRFHGRNILKTLKRHREVGYILLPAGEKHKTLKTANGIYACLIQNRVDRRTPVIALGGGVIGDVAGFAAATFLRGVPLVQVPTTLLAQVDSSIGGKTGVDLKEGKNLVGAFYQPRFVLLDENFLSTLPRREFICGLAEVIKYAAIFDAGLFRNLEENMESILRSRGRGLEPIVRRCCELKAWVVEKDEKEILGIRSKLNFGHTLGHAIESLTQYGKYSHGEAIAMGMAFAAERSVEKSSFPKAQAQRLIRLLAKVGLPTRWPAFSPVAYSKALGRDKKRVSKDIHFVYLRKIGKSEVISTPLQEILKGI